MKVATGKILRRRNKIKDDFVFPSSEVTEGTLKIWRSLPDMIRLDPSLAIIRQEHEKVHGEIVEEEDPLPYENDDENVSQEELENTKRNTITNIEFTNISIISDNDATKRVEIETSKAAYNSHGHSHEHGAHGHGAHEVVDHTANRTKVQKWYHRIKIGALVVVWIFFTYLLMSYGDKELEHRQLAVLPQDVKDFLIHETPLGPRIGIHLKGAFDGNIYGNTSNLLYVYLELSPADEHIVHSVSQRQIVTEVREIHVVDDELIDHAEDIESKIVFNIGDDNFTQLQNGESILHLRMYTNFDAGLPLVFTFDPAPINEQLGVIYAAIVLLGLYVLIVWDVVHRTFAAIIASTLALSVLAVMNQKPSMEEIIGWIDTETLLLLFGMMVLVAILSETGVFDFLAVYAYKITNGRVWPLINCLALFTAILSAFLDNVTTILLMTPVTIRLCEVMGLNPIPILMTMVIYSNVGGTATPVGDPPNVIISSNPVVSSSGINFLTFTMHMTFGVIMVMIQTYFQIRFKFRNMEDLRFSEPRGIQELRQEISVWERAAASLSSYSRDEDLVRETLQKKVEHLQRVLKKRLATGKLPVETYKETLKDLQEKYPIRNKKLLIKSLITLVFVITFFFLHAAPHIQRLSIGWTALLGAVLLLILADREDIESVMARVEWTTLLFFAALFILMESLSELGLIAWIGSQTEYIIMACPEQSRLAVAIIIILWVSAFASAFVDNIPLTTMMIKIVISLADNAELGLPIQPLVWALAFGACLGGNGTLIGASANVVCAGVAQQHGYKFTFMDFFKVGFPIMIGHTLVATAYLMISHVLFTWH